MFIISISECFSSVYMYLVLQLNTSCLREGPPTLTLIVFPILVCPVAVMSLLLPILSSCYGHHYGLYSISCFIASKITILFLSAHLLQLFYCFCQVVNSCICNWAAASSLSSSCIIVSIVLFCLCTVLLATSLMAATSYVACILTYLPH